MFQLANRFIVIIIAYSGLYKLQHLPPGFLHTLIELDPLHFNVLNDMNIPVISIFRRIYDLVRLSIFSGMVSYVQECSCLIPIYYTVCLR